MFAIKGIANMDMVALGMVALGNLLAFLVKQQQGAVLAIKEHRILVGFRTSAIFTGALHPAASLRAA